MAARTVLTTILAGTVRAAVDGNVDHSQSCVSINGIVKCGEDGGTEWIVQCGRAAPLLIRRAA